MYVGFIILGDFIFFLYIKCFYQIDFFFFVYAHNFFGTLLRFCSQGVQVIWMSLNAGVEVEKQLNNLLREPCMGVTPQHPYNLHCLLSLLLLPPNCIFLMFKIFLVIPWLKPARRFDTETTLHTLPAWTNTNVYVILTKCIWYHILILLFIAYYGND